MFRPDSNGNYRYELWGSPFGGEPYPPRIKVGGSPFQFSPREVHELFVATAILTLAFSIAFSGGLFGIIKNPINFVFSLAVAFIAVITAFAFHEMGHKYAAIKFGFWAEFNYFMGGLLLALAVSFFGFLFAAPGAVVIFGGPNRRENGVISAAGPTVNLSMGILFLLLAIPVKILTPFNLPVIFLGYISIINIFIGGFNMIPIPPLDGFKIIRWSIPVYTLMLISFVVLFVFAQSLIY